MIAKSMDDERTQPSNGVLVRRMLGLAAGRVAVSGGIDLKDADRCRTTVQAGRSFLRCC